MQVVAFIPPLPGTQNKDIVKEINKGMKSYVYF